MEYIYDGFPVVEKETLNKIINNVNSDSGYIKKCILDVYNNNFGVYILIDLICKNFANIRIEEDIVIITGSLTYACLKEQAKNEANPLEKMLEKYNPAPKITNIAYTINYTEEGLPRVYPDEIFAKMDLGITIEQLSNEGRVIEKEIIKSIADMYIQDIKNENNVLEGLYNKDILLNNERATNKQEKLLRIYTVSVVYGALSAQAQINQEINEDIMKELELLRKVIFK